MAATFFALAETGSALLIGRFFDWGRAEALLFFAFRPWFLLIAAILLANWPWKFRHACYGIALLLAGITQSIFLQRLGATNPWPEMVRGLAGGLLLVLVADGLIQAGRRVMGGKAGRILTALAVAFLLLIPGILRPYEKIVIGADESVDPARRPKVTVMTSLPIIWGEAGLFASGSQPAASWKWLERWFELQPIDHLDASSLANTKLLLVAQPRLLAPEELVAIDRWIRSGGHALILADPDLAWPTALPPGDVRRPVAFNMITPLLAHWGVGFDPVPETGAIWALIRTGTAQRKLLLLGTAKLVDRGGDCRAEAFFMLDCPIGHGRAIIIADSDLLHDSTSITAGNRDIQRHNRLSDNVAAVADLLDRLAGMEPKRSSVAWMKPGVQRSKAVAIALGPLAAMLILAFWLVRAGGRHSPTYPQSQQQASSSQVGRTNHE